MPVLYVLSFIFMGPGALIQLGLNSLLPEEIAETACVIPLAVDAVPLLVPWPGNVFGMSSSCSGS